MKVKSIKYIVTLFVATSFISLQAQTEQMVADTVTTDTAAVVLPWPQNVQARLDTLMLDPSQPTPCCIAMGQSRPCALPRR